MPADGTPEDAMMAAKGIRVEMDIKGVLPRSTCFLQADPAAFALRWSADRYISLHAVSEVTVVHRRNSLRVATGRWMKRAHQLQSPASGQPKLQLPRSTPSSSDQPGRRRRSSIGKFLHSLKRSAGAVRVTYKDLKGVERELVLTLPPSTSMSWSSSLAALRQAAPPPPGDAGHMLWTLVCMRATGEVTPGFVRHADLRAVLNRANVSLDRGRANEALQRALQAPLPPWMRRDAEGLLNAHQVATALASLVYAQPELTRMFDAYSVGKSMSRSRWLAFVHAEQLDGSDPLPLLSNPDEAEREPSGVEQDGAEVRVVELAQLRVAERLDTETRDAMLRDAEAEFERTIQAGSGDLSTDQGLTLEQFLRLLLSPDNDAVAPAVEQDLSAPLTHYWGACSHNSYIIGDQLTGLSSADAYRRQLIQGCRHVEIDCWDGKAMPMVTHGHTFVTIESFAAVAEAVAETAFITSDLPVILSLEMHCSPPQQHQIAKLLMQHLGPMLLLYDELCASQSPSSLLELKRRVLVKGKVKGLASTGAKASKPKLAKLLTRINTRLNVARSWKEGRSGAKLRNASAKSGTNGPITDVAGHAAFVRVESSATEMSDTVHTSGEVQSVDVSAAVEMSGAEASVDESHVQEATELGQSGPPRATYTADAIERLASDGNGLASGGNGKKERGTDQLLARVLALRSASIAHFLSADSKWPLPITSINEDRILEEVSDNEDAMLITTAVTC